MTTSVPVPSVAALVDALNAVASAALEPSTASAALYWARILSRTDGSVGEETIRKLRLELGHYKSDFNDVARDEKYRAMIDAASHAAMQAMNHFITLRRPDLNFVNGPLET